MKRAYFISKYNRLFKNNQVLPKVFQFRTYAYKRFKYPKPLVQQEAQPPQDVANSGIDMTFIANGPMNGTGAAVIQTGAGAAQFEECKPLSRHLLQTCYQCQCQDMILQDGASTTARIKATGPEATEPEVTEHNFLSGNFEWSLPNFKGLQDGVFKIERSEDLDNKRGYTTAVFNSRLYKNVQGVCFAPTFSPFSNKPAIVQVSTQGSTEDEVSNVRDFFNKNEDSIFKLRDCFKNNRVTNQRCVSDEKMKNDKIESSDQSELEKIAPQTLKEKIVDFTCLDWWKQITRDEPVFCVVSDYK